MEVRIGSAGGGKRGGMPSWRVFWCYHAVMSLSNIHESSQRGLPARLARLPARLSRLAAMFCRHHSPQPTVQSNVVRTPRCEPCR